MTQGPIERLFGFKSLVVTTAGGRRVKPGQQGGDTHEARLVGLEDAESVRDLILGALRQHRDAAAELQSAAEKRAANGRHPRR